MSSISSAANPHVKRLLSLRHKASVREAEALFVVEGWREFGHCLKAGLTVEAVYVCPEIAGDSMAFLEGYGGTAPFLLTPAIYAKVAYRGGTEGIVAVVRQRLLRLEDIPLSKTPLVVVLEGVEKPGNVGAVLRTADAAGVDAVVVCDSPADIYNPNTIRSSVGALFTVPTVTTSSEECIAWLRGKGMRILTAQLQDSVPYYSTDMTLPTAIAFGSERDGLTPLWREASDAHIRIPMLGSQDSLNISVSAAVLLFEAVRQRNKTPL